MLASTKRLSGTFAEASVGRSEVRPPVNNAAPPATVVPRKRRRLMPSRVSLEIARASRFFFAARFAAGEESFFISLPPLLRARPHSELRLEALCGSGAG